MAAPTATANTPTVSLCPRSYLHARIVSTTLTAIGFAALAWATFVPPLTCLIYSLSDSVTVGRYRIGSLNPRIASLSCPLSVGSIVLAPLPATAAALAMQHDHLPTRIPLLERVGAVASQYVCIVTGQVRIDGVPLVAALPIDRLSRVLPSLQLYHHFEPGELFLLGVTNPTSFDGRYFGPVNASAVIGIAYPIWLEVHP